MQLYTVAGRLTLASANKLFFWSWLLSWGALFSALIVILFGVTMVTGEMNVNGELVRDRGQALTALAPMIILLPIVVAIQAFLFSAFLTFGAWLYRLRRPIEVIARPTL